MPIFLHVGCGPKHKDQTTRGFAQAQWEERRLDIDEHAAPDFVGTMTDMSAVPAASVQAVFSSHSIEHLYPFEVPLALAEFARVLDDDGYAVITCPDLQSVCALVAQDQLMEPAYVAPAGPVAPFDILYGLRSSLAQGKLFMAHRCGFTRRVLDLALRQAGFPTVATLARPQHFDLWAIASKRPRADAEMHAIAAEHIPR